MAGSLTHQANHWQAMVTTAIPAIVRTTCSSTETTRQQHTAKRGVTALSALIRQFKRPVMHGIMTTREHAVSGSTPQFLGVSEANRPA
jgi:hypothetical protein